MYRVLLALAITLAIPGTVLAQTMNLGMGLGDISSQRGGAGTPVTFGLLLAQDEICITSWGGGCILSWTQ